MCFLALAEVQGVLSKSILRALLLNAARRRSSNVSRSVVGLRHLTRNVSAIWIILSVNSELSKLWIRDKLLRVAFSAASLVEILLVVSHPVSAWSAGRLLVSLFPSAVHISWSGNIDFLIPELQTSQSSWRPRYFQLTVIWYNRHTKTSVTWWQCNRCRSWPVT